MKALLIILPVLLTIRTCIVQKTDTGQASKNITQPAAERNDSASIDFDKQVKPIFVKNCSPCHFPGGKMYDKLPFDKDTTILNHYEAILKRIKNEEENNLLKKFISQNKNGLPKASH